MSEPASAAAADLRALRRLSQALLITFVCHAGGMVAMAAGLARMLPGGGTADTTERVRLIAEHPWWFRLGWLPWHLTALSDLLLAAALLGARRVPRGLRWLSALLTAAAVVPDQGGQVLWETRGVELAQQAAQSGDLGAYLAYESFVFPMTAAWAALLYTLGAIVWSVSFARARLWSPALTWLSAPLWGLFVAISVGPLLPEGVRPPPPLVAAGNAAGFVAMELWFAAVAEQVLRASRASELHGRWAPWRAPGGGAWGWLLEAAANSRFARVVCSALPTVTFRSDITDVIYVNFLLPAERLLPLVPEGLELQRVGPGYAMFSFLTYRHGHFGPSMLGPLRRLFPSPIQSNWRVYVRDPHTGKEGIYFTTNVVTTTLHSIGARLMSDTAPMHLPARGELRRGPDGAVTIEIDAGQGTAPAFSLDLRPTDDRQLRGPWAECFADYQAMLAYAVPQDRALATQPWRRTTSRNEIHLGIPLEACEPLAGSVRSSDPLFGDAEPLCFRVPSVDFVLEPEVVDRW